MGTFIVLKIFRPEEYEDVCDELVLEDFMENPKGFQVELKCSSSESAKAEK